jgi:hypothetical protein
MGTGSKLVEGRVWTRSSGEEDGRTEETEKSQDRARDTREQEARAERTAGEVAVSGGAVVFEGGVGRVDER